MQINCSKESALAISWLFYNVSSSFFLLLLFIYTSSIFLLNFFHFIGSYPLIQRNQEEFDYTLLSDEEEEDEELEEQDDIVADVLNGGDSLVFLQKTATNSTSTVFEEYRSPYRDVDDDCDNEDDLFFDDQFSVHGSESEHDDDDGDNVEISTRDSDFVLDSCPNQQGGDKICPRINNNNGEKEEHYEKIHHDEDEKFLVFSPSKLESKILPVHQVHDQDKEKDGEDDGYFGDSCTNGSTSKSSSEWRSSIKTEDPFSSSSRRSCPKWESYTVFQKYDEEMMFLHRITAQKLHETESLRSIQICPRSISERIIARINKNPSDINFSNLRRYQNSYHELEGAYVAQICWTWEALNWNYKNFERKRAAINKNNFDHGCPAQIAQHFQQFPVLLQRYVENEPYEQGRRPEIYARMRLLAPKLLLVPEYRDYEEDEKEDGFGSRISSASFVMIMEDCIRTFLNFLKADKEKPYHILKSYFCGRRNKRGSLDPNLLNFLHKVNKKKKTKVEDLRRARRCIRKRRLNVEEEMEILMSLIDLKLVSRVLRISGEMSEEQLHWCEEKMSKVRVSDGKLQRDSTPTFFPPH